MVCSELVIKCNEYGQLSCAKDGQRTFVASYRNISGFTEMCWALISGEHATAHVHYQFNCVSLFFYDDHFVEFSMKLSSSYVYACVFDACDEASQFYQPNPSNCKHLNSKPKTQFIKKIVNAFQFR